MAMCWNQQSAIWIKQGGELDLGEASAPLFGYEFFVAHAPARHHAIKFAHEDVHQRLDWSGLLEQSVLYRVLQERREVIRWRILFPR